SGTTNRMFDRSRLLIITVAVDVVAIVAAIVALIVIGSGSGSDGGTISGGGKETQAERVIRQMLNAGQDADTGISVKLNGLPDDYPAGIPRFTAGTPIATVRSLTPQGLAFITLYETTK